MTSHRPRVAILGAGGRGSEAYGRWFVEHSSLAQVVAVADLNPHRRDTFAARAGVDPAGRFADWRDVFRHAEALGVEAVVIALPDDTHVEPTLAAAELGLPTLLEKPIAPTAESLRDLDRRLAGSDSRIAVCHVLRETPFWRNVHDVVTSGVLGRLVTIRLEENIGFWHFAHSYVRGNWRREDTSSPMALAKTCHDFDLIRWLAGDAPTHVASVGGLMHFREDNAPEGAPSHCLDGCPAADTCPFYAPRYYVDALSEVHGWPVALLGPDTSRQGRLEALQTGPYGRCVYRSDNDVADHQQTIMHFPDGLTASLTASAHTGDNTRTMQITGTAGEIRGRMDTGELDLQIFSPDTAAADALVPQAEHRVNGPLSHTVYHWNAVAEDVAGGDHRGHGGGDDALSERFIRAVASGDFDAHISTTFEASLDSHWMAFASERARLSAQAVSLAEVRTG